MDALEARRNSAAPGVEHGPHLTQNFRLRRLPRRCASTSSPLGAQRAMWPATKRRRYLRFSTTFHGSSEWSCEAYGITTSPRAGTSQATSRSLLAPAASTALSGLHGLTIGGGSAGAARSRVFSEGGVAAWQAHRPPVAKKRRVRACAIFNDSASEPADDPADDPADGRDGPLKRSAIWRIHSASCKRSASYPRNVEAAAAQASRRAR
mmetsp:Transcript_36490/g.85250  ORF Transcript_36490/g.85250 Transcript_36490/m.85250 type:complete len:208 (-) Transcript_36490:424-1047(-)